MTKKRKVTNNNWVVSKLEGKENAFLYSSCFLGFDAGETVKVDSGHTFEAELKVSEMLLYQETEEECDKFIEEEYRVGEQIEDEMMKWL